MPKVKIISNPYERKIAYQRYDENTDTWNDINYENNSSIALLSDELTTGVFPFVVEKVVDEIIRAYRNGDEKIEIVFEGTDDEYTELKLVCEDEDHRDCVSLTRSGRYLENARDILPDIIGIYQKLSPLISQNVRDKEKVEVELNKFTDASNDIIPICVLGNYSAGKSTFINALLGSEIMPSGDEPVTAKIYKISRSEEKDAAEVSFHLGQEEIRIRIDSAGYRFVHGQPEGKVADSITQALDGIEEEGLSVRVNTVLTVLNGFNEDTEDEKSTDGEQADGENAGLSDLIEISIPFVGGVWDETKSRFVIFDTPGSNSASNEKHFQVLTSAMENLSNGLPVFIADYNTLDSIDNEKLYNVIHDMKELDSRFTMIVVNRADMASLPKKGFTGADVAKILSEAIPRNLYSEGIFFVSSIMGLGAKLDGAFTGEHYSEVYEDQKQKYLDPDSRFYKQLYLYDIMPGKTKEEAVQKAAQCKDLVYANSGLYTVEEEIQTFAGKYSSYNKCLQSGMFLEKLIRITSEEIDSAKAEREASKERRKEALERDKKELYGEIEQTAEDLENQFVLEYEGSMNSVIEESRKRYYQESLEDEQEDFTRKQEKLNNAGQQREELQQSKKLIRKNFVSNFTTFMKTPSMSALKKMGSDLYVDSKDSIRRGSEVHVTKKETMRAVADQLVAMVNRDFKRYSAETQEMLEKESQKYWLERAMDIKKALVAIVTGSDVLTEEKKGELSDIIISYEDIDFEHLDIQLFEKKDYRLLGTDKLNLEKLRQNYNDEMEASVSRIYMAVQASHAACIYNWIQKLLSVIIANLVDYNPDLRNQQKLIDEETEKIQELERRQQQVRNYAEEVTRMMSWKEA